MLGEGCVYYEDVDDLVVFIFGNGVLMVLCVVCIFEVELKWKVCVVDLCWLVLFNDVFIVV